ncbi:recombinase family protein [Clostridium prolinivorans]|uniref:recombinase family protein n=1 Tax=Clostridium prolinivorans TaxID=2769420 RepID=UPI001D182B5A|nr:recombinase family protein [Clostridium prolinivorans]
MLTVLSSFAQEESKNVSDSLKWRVKKKFERGKLIINTTRFLGYDKDEYGDLVINPKEAEIVKRIFEDYLKGKRTFTIAKELNSENVLVRYRAKQFIEILKDIDKLEDFDVDMYFRITEKMTVFGGKKIK